MVYGCSVTVQRHRNSGNLTYQLTGIGSKNLKIDISELWSICFWGWHLYLLAQASLGLFSDDSGNTEEKADGKDASWRCAKHGFPGQGTSLTQQLWESGFKAQSRSLFKVAGKFLFPKSCPLQGCKSFC